MPLYSCIRITFVCFSLYLLLSTPASASEEWAGSDSCIECHEDRHQSWHRTYHRTMTQEASADTILGRFDGRPRTYWGMTVVPIQRDGGYWFQYYRPGSAELVAEYPVLRTVGSHRYQQYLTQVDGAAGTYYRLHLLWHIEDRRWVHMNGVFLGPDQQHFDAQVAVWNHNCIFCHNTGPVPNILNLEEMQGRAALGLAVDSANEAIYESSVAELGIACETCHGPGARHVAANQSTLTRWWNQLKGSDDTIIHPDRLDQQRSVQVCGQCHGQRVIKDSAEMFEWLEHGPTYRAGDDLFASVELVAPDTRIPGDAEQDRFEKRFWGDGTPRLTAYEYQGLRQSECYQQSQLTCNTCHTMHSGDPSGMLTDANRAGQPCLDCHQAIADDLVAHTHHSADSSGSECQNCHMPRIVYGVMAIHRSHHIEIPDPAAASNAGRPNACNQCHLNRSPQWAAEQTERWWPGSSKVDGNWQRDDQAPRDLADGAASLYAGDPVQRALAAEAIGHGVESRQLDARHWIPHLLAAMTDNYPAIRRFASRSLAQANQAQLQDPILSRALQQFDFIADVNQRNQSLALLLERWQELAPDFPGQPPAELLLTPEYLPTDQVDLLQEMASQRSGEIHIGE
ncbi:MAG: multiheme c-type cytochrome [Wenzhouxiangellaceae bacterium]